MTPFAWLLGLFLPACGAIGAQGLPVPPIMDMTTIARPSSPNTALAGPADFKPTPDLVTPVYPLSAERLYASVRAMAEGEPLVFLAAAYDEQRQVHYVVRSAMLNFPDLVAVQVTATGPESSTLLLYSRSVYGYSDLGANRGRLQAWLATLDQRLGSNSGR